MIVFFRLKQHHFAVETATLNTLISEKLAWLFGDALVLEDRAINGTFTGPRKEMLTPWSTNAVEITQNMGIEGIRRIEIFKKTTEQNPTIDSMLEMVYQGLDQSVFKIDIAPEPIRHIDDIKTFDAQEGLSLSEEEITYLEEMARKLGRSLTDSEVFGFSQVNSEHCRHKIFNGQFIIDGEAKENSLFKRIKKTSKAHPNDLVSAYKDNVAFLKGPKITQFAPEAIDKPSFYKEKDIESVLSLKAETHNFPTTVEPFNGAATGAGGEIRDRLAGGKGSLPLAGTAVYMTAYSRLNNSEQKPWEAKVNERDWLYQTPMDILIKASNGASDFGNKFGQPLICGSVLTFEHFENQRYLGFDKVIMQAGGVGYGKAVDALKDTPQKDDRLVILGGDNYRIGMGGAAVSSADTGSMDNQLELNAVQRSNPEMQKRVANTIRAMVESSDNPIVSIHDHGAGGHLNCLSELVEDTGGSIDMDALPIGDPTLSARERIGNESQERMGLVVTSEDLPLLKKVAERENSPIYDVGVVRDDHHFEFESKTKREKPIDLPLNALFGNAPKTIIKDKTVKLRYQALAYDETRVTDCLKQVLQLEAVACKDWLTNKVDRCVGGKVAQQQCVGSLQLPLSNVAVTALDYKGKDGIATAIGHAPIVGLIDEKAGARHAIAEAMSNLVFAPLENKISSVSLSANWMWPCKNHGEDARLYNAVQAVSDFAIDLGINIPTGKDSLSMKQKYKDKEVIAPGTVIISAMGQCKDVQKVVTPVLQTEAGNAIYYINLSCDEFRLGGSSLAQVLSKIGTQCPDIKDTTYFKKAFDSIQELIAQGVITAGHDVSSGGLVTTMLEMCFPENHTGAVIDTSTLNAKDFTTLLFAENSGIVLQTQATKILEDTLNGAGIQHHKIGYATKTAKVQWQHGAHSLSLNVAEYRDVWYQTSYLLDCEQSGAEKAKERFENYKKQPLNFVFPTDFKGKMPQKTAHQPVAAIIREKGSNSEREMAYALHLAGFKVKDVHMTDLTSGRENLEAVQLIAAVGGFSNSDVLGSAKGWAGTFRYNDMAKKALNNFFQRSDTLSLGICNGCQLFIELGLINPNHQEKPKMFHNDSHKHECSFTSVRIQENNSVMLSDLAGSTLGVWISHGEGKFHLPYEESRYKIVGKYGYDAYPANPNGSDHNTAMLCSDDGRHLVMMPHIERSLLPWQWAVYPKGRNDEVSPWMRAFRRAKAWLEQV